MELLKDNIFNIVGVISLIVGILAFIDGKVAKKNAKNEKTIREYLFDVAEKNIDKELTENHINQLKQVETELSGAINEKIPILAKKTSLINSLEELKNSIAQNYVEYNHIQEKLKNLDVETAEIPKQISDIVVKNILPDYYRRKEKEKNLIIIAVLFLIYIIISNVPIFYIFQYLIAILMYNPLASLLELTFPKNRKWRVQLKCFYGAIIGVYVMLFSFSGINIGMIHSGGNSFIEMKMSANNIVCIVMGLISYFLISFAVGIELKILVGDKVSAYVNASRKRRIIVYLLYYLFWCFIIALIIFMSLFTYIIHAGNNSYKIFNYRLLHICVIGGIICFTALVTPYLPSKLKFSKKHFLKKFGTNKNETIDLDKK